MLEIFIIENFIFLIFINSIFIINKKLENSIPANKDLNDEEGFLPGRIFTSLID